MKNKLSSNLWIPLWIDKWLLGSTRLELSLEERAIWIDLLALGGKDEGFIRANINMPYNLKQLAGLLIVDENLLHRSIEKFIELGKIEKFDNGILYIKSWKNYNFSNSYKRWLKHRGKIQTHNVCKETDNVYRQTNSATHNIIYNRITNNKTKYDKHINSKDGFLIIQSPEEFIQLFHYLCPSLPHVSRLTSDRRRKIFLRLKENPQRDYWIAIFKKLNEIYIPPTKNHPKGWKPNLDWLVRNESNHLRIYEGQFDSQHLKHRQQGAESLLRRISAEEEVLDEEK